MKVEVGWQMNTNWHWLSASCFLYLTSKNIDLFNNEISDPELSLKSFEIFKNSGVWEQ
jgi:hypothetical protein